MEPLRIGTLGAARITPMALLKPAAKRGDARVVAVAARDRAKAEKFARKHGIPTVHDSYEALIADPEVEAIYNPLPNGLHGKWTIAALEAGKHVLCEKPFTANAAEAEQVAAVAQRTGLVVMEAFHYRYHPLADRLREIVGSGMLGRVRRVETRMVFPLPQPGDIRWNLTLAGGSTMDMGCYTIHQLRTLAGEEPTVVVGGGEGAVSRRRPVDARRHDVPRRQHRQHRVRDARVPGAAHVGARRGRGGHAAASQHDRAAVLPSRHHRDPRTARPAEKVRGEHTYWYQLGAFARPVREDRGDLTPPSDSIANMKVIDDVYRAAGLEPRRPTP